MTCKCETVSLDELRNRVQCSFYFVLLNIFLVIVPNSTRLFIDVILRDVSLPWPGFALNVTGPFQTDEDVSNQAVTSGFPLSFGLVLLVPQLLPVAMMNPFLEAVVSASPPSCSFNAFIAQWLSCVWTLAKWRGSTQCRKSTLSFSYVVPFYVVYKQSFTRRVERLQTP